MFMALLGNIFNVAAGGLMGMLADWIESNNETKRLQIAALTETDRIKALYGGNDKADKWTKATRRLLALIIIGTMCSIMLFCVLFDPQIALQQLIDKENSFFSKLFFNTVDKATINTNLLSYLTNFFAMCEMVVGFYFVRVKG